MKHQITFLFAIVLQLGGAISIQAQQKITLQITRQSDTGTTTFDTTFLAPRSFDVDGWLDQNQLRKTQPGESVSVTIIISDEEDQRSQADVYRPTEELQREPGMMGVYLDDNRHHTRGVAVVSIVKGGAAFIAGLAPEDTIVSMNGIPIKNFEELVNAKKGLFAGDALPIVYKRGTELVEAELQLQGRQPIKLEAENVQTHSPKAFLGVYPEDLTREIARELNLDNLQGVYIQNVVTGSAASQAGLRPKDVITIMNGRDTQAAWELSEVLRDLHPGDSLEITYVRNGQEARTLAILQARNSPTPQVEQRPRRILIEETRPYLGVVLRTNTQGPGVPITQVERHSAADEAGLQAGDVLMKIGGKRTKNYDSLASVMRSFSPNEEVSIVYLRDERRRKTKTTLGYSKTNTWILADPNQNTDPDMIVEEVKQRDRREGEVLSRQIENPTLDMAFFEFYPNPNQGIFSINFELESVGN
ncbi:MAG: PDZ domain-containing protein, partial [Bacteroidia bacterium]|nr:PDZ domain-containing protein [Bacteroidia bacterium]